MGGLPARVVSTIPLKMASYASCLIAVISDDELILILEPL